MLSIRHAALTLVLIALPAIATGAERIAPANTAITPPTPEWIAAVEKAAPSRPTVKAEKRSLLVFSLYTGFHHKVIPHVDRVFEILGKKSGAFDVKVTCDIEHLAAESLRAYDVLVLNNNCSRGPRRDLLLDELERNSKYGNLSKEERQKRAEALESSLLEFVASGGGLVVIHGAPVLRNNSPGFTGMVGAAFDYHPPSQEVTLRPVDADHPLVAAFRGKSPFIHRDEPYCFKGAYEKFEFRPLLAMDTGSLKDPRGRVGEIPRYVAWIKPHGKGRVFYCSPSHYPETYESATILRFLLDGMQYAAGDLECNDSPLRPKADEKRAESERKASREAENVLLYQRESGGWPKNYDRRRTPSDDERAAILEDRSRNDAMIDNGATHTEIRIVADAYGKTRDARFKDSALRGIRYLLDGQYENGGWPQRFPDSRGYARHITFNDNAMVGVMRLLRDVARGEEPFSFVPGDVRSQCRRAVERGIRCILRCQIRVKGRRTVWCAQHDEVTFEPRKARSYELASLSGSESVGIVRLLMEIEDPDEEVIAAIEDAVSWFERARLEGIRVARVKDGTAPRGYDRVVVEDPEAPPMWARFYDIETNRPIFCSRDGIPRRTLAEISYERRNGYSWLGHYAEDLLERDLPAWRRRLGRG